MANELPIVLTSKIGSEIFLVYDSIRFVFCFVKVARETTIAVVQRISDRRWERKETLTWSYRILCDLLRVSLCNNDCLAFLSFESLR